MIHQTTTFEVMHFVLSLLTDSKEANYSTMLANIITNLIEEVEAA